MNHITFQSEHSDNSSYSKYSYITLSPTPHLDIYPNQTPHNNHDSLFVESFNPPYPYGSQRELPPYYTNKNWPSNHRLGYIKYGINFPPTKPPYHNPVTKILTRDLIHIYPETPSLNKHPHLKIKECTKSPLTAERYIPTPNTSMNILLNPPQPPLPQ